MHALDGALDRLGDPDPAYLSRAEKEEVLLGLAREEQRLTALRLRVQGAADEVALERGARDAGAVVAHELRRDPHRVAVEQRLVDALERWPETASAWREGGLNGEQATVIADALDRLPRRVGPELLAKAEAHMIALARDYGPHALKALGTRLWEVIAPEDADEELGRQLEDEERAARASTRLDLRPMGDGSTRISGRIPEATAMRLATLLEAYTSPRRDHLTGRVRDAATGARLRADRLRGQAFCALIEHADPDKLPRHGGTATTLVVTMQLDTLLSATGAGALLDGTPLSAGQVRRLACTAEVIGDGAGHRLGDPRPGSRRAPVHPSTTHRPGRA